MQTYDVLSQFSKEYTNLRCMLLVGGTSVQQDANQYKEHGGQILIATPGRLLDVKARLETTMIFKRLEVLVLDEADKLLDMGFKDSINQILSFLPKQRRTGLFSATQTKEVKELVRAGLRNPVIVSVTVQHQPQPKTTDKNKTATSNQSTLTQVIPTSLKSWYLIREYDERPYELLKFIRSHLNAKIIVFLATCACVDYYSAVFHQLTKDYPSILPSKYTVIGFHGKMVTKKRTLSYKRFKSLSPTEGGLMFSTDVAARGIDIPDVDWIVQLTAPKDPSFFVHRIGRTARAGKEGQALIFLTNEENSYLTLLRGRGVPLSDADDDTIPAADSVIRRDDIVSFELPLDHYPASNKVPYKPAYEFLSVMKMFSKQDRAILEMSSAAFVAFIRAYTEHLCSYIFRLAELDIGAVARSYALLRLPKMAETRGVKGRPIVFDTDPTNTSTIPYRNQAREEARQKKLQAALAEEDDDDEGEIDSVVDTRQVSDKQLSKRSSSNDSSDDDSSDDSNSDNDTDNSDSNAVAHSDMDSDEAVETATVKTTRTAKTSMTNKSGRLKKAWIPEEQYKELLAEKEKSGVKGRHVPTFDGTLVTEKRQRKRKQSYVQKFKAEWDEIADEEALYRKFKKGKISKAEYEEKLISVGNKNDDEDEDDSDDEVVSRKQVKKMKMQQQGKKIDYRNKKKHNGGGKR
jgi:ATP-dependent RNA helicase DDX55/SPB4